MLTRTPIVWMLLVLHLLALPAPIASTTDSDAADAQRIVESVTAQTSGRAIEMRAHWIADEGEPAHSAQTRTGNKPSQMIPGAPPRLTERERWMQVVRNDPDCVNDREALAECRFPDEEPGQAAPSAAMVRAIAREVVLELQLPSPAPLVGPDPSVNEWNMAVVGFPLWLWTDGPRNLATTRNAYGVTFNLQATHVSTVFEMGDGKTITCATTQPYPTNVEPGTPSPVCGYRYTKGKKRPGTYTVTATTHWNVRWSALGYSGTLPAQVSASRELPVGELQAVVTR